MSISPQSGARNLDALLREFNEEYLTSEKGKAHLRMYESSRRTARENWERIERTRNEGRAVDELVLLTLLPHRRSTHNRQRGTWIHVAPVITRDVKTWFERVGWARNEDWPAIASAVLAFVVPHHGTEQAPRSVWSSAPRSAAAVQRRRLGAKADGGAGAQLRLY